MERQKVLKDIHSLSFIVIIYLVGIIGHSNSITLPWMVRLTPIALFISGCLVLSTLLMDKNFRILLWCSGTFIMTFTLEIAGVYSGLIFGNYHYGDSLGIKILNVPVIIGFNWVFVLLGSIRISELVFSNSLLKASVSALLAISFDVVMEPVAVKLSYWIWSGNFIPIQNYLVWGILGFFSSIVYDRLKLKADHTFLPEKYFLIQFIFFLFLNLFIK